MAACTAEKSHIESNISIFLLLKAADNTQLKLLGSLAMQKGNRSQ